MLTFQNVLVAERVGLQSKQDCQLMGRGRPPNLVFNVPFIEQLDMQKIAV